MPLTFRQLQALHAVATMGTVNAAADYLGISGPAVSMILRDAAKAAGFPLFSRLRGSMRPTEEANLLVASIETLLDAYADIERLTEQLVNIRLGKLIVASIPTLTGHLLPNALAELNRTYPEINTVVVTLRGPEVLDEVRKHHCHLGLTMGAERTNGVELHDLFKGDVIAVSRRDHPLSADSRIKLEELGNYPVVSVPAQSPFGRILDATCLNANVVIAKRTEVTHASAAIAFARAGLGLAIVDPLSAPAHDDPMLSIAPIDPPIELTYQLVLPESSRPSRAALKLISAIRSVAKGLVDPSNCGLRSTPWSPVNPTTVRQVTASEPELSSP